MRTISQKSLFFTFHCVSGPKAHASKILSFFHLHSVKTASTAVNGKTTALSDDFFLCVSCGLPHKSFGTGRDWDWIPGRVEGLDGTGD